MKTFSLMAAAAALALLPSIAMAGGNITANGSNVSVSAFTGAFHGGKVGTVTNSVGITAGSTTAQAPANHAPSGNITANGGSTGVGFSAITSHKGTMGNVGNTFSYGGGGVIAQTY